MRHGVVQCHAKSHWINQAILAVEVYWQAKIPGGKTMLKFLACPSGTANIQNNCIP